MSRRDRLYPYRRAVAKNATRRERSAGLGFDDPAALWLSLSAAEREAFAREVRSPTDMAVWRAERRSSRGRA